MGRGWLCCSFCGKQQNEVRKLIAGPTVFICDECIEACADIVKEELEKEGRGRANQPAETLFSLLDSYPELAKMSLMDFLRTHRGSPAVSTVTIGDILTLCLKAAHGQNLVLPDARSTSQNDQRPGNQFAVGPVEDESKVLWKLRGVTDLTYNFHGLSALQKWAGNLSGARDAFVSIDGKEWKRYGDFVDTISMAKGAGREISPVTAFRMTPSLPPGAKAGGGNPLDGDPGLANEE